MAVEQAKAFIAKVSEDETLAKKLSDAQAAYTGDKASGFDAVVAPIAKEAGFEFTAEEFKAAVETGEGELGEDDLEAVAGGGGLFGSLAAYTKYVQSMRAQGHQW